MEAFLFFNLLDQKEADRTSCRFLFSPELHETYCQSGLFVKTAFPADLEDLGFLVISADYIPFRKKLQKIVRS